MIVSQTKLFGFFLAILVTVVSTSVQAEIPSGAVYSTTPNLPFGDINVVVLTDIHSWVSSHRRQEPYYDADLGDVLSFWEHVKDYCDNFVERKPRSASNTTAPARRRDCFLVNNGDFVDGTGLSRTINSENDASSLIPLLEKMPYDAITVGNHELYSKNNIEYMTRPGGYVDWWGDRYLTSNIQKKECNPGRYLALPEEEPLGSRYKILNGTSGGTRLLTFGFLYNMKDYAHCSGIAIEDVGHVMDKKWFQKALLEEDYDAILILAHMDLVDPLVDTIRLGIRNLVGSNVPVVFITGHTHYRGVKQLDNNTMTFEAGKYLDTVGFVSFPRKESVGHNDYSDSPLFHHTFLDTNRGILFQKTLGFSQISDGQTKNGKELSMFIEHTRRKLGLENEIGCAPQSYFVSKHMDAPDSLWGLYRDHVIPKIFLPISHQHGKRDTLPVAMLLKKSTWRYNLYNTTSLIVDDIDAIAPFNDTVIDLGRVSKDAILKINGTLNKHGSSVLPYYILIGNMTLGTNEYYQLYTHEFEAKTIQKALEDADPSHKVEIVKTGITSTMIWLAFVQEYWSCDGSVDSWTDKVFPKFRTKNEGIHQTKTPVDAVLIGIVSLCTALICLHIRKHGFLYNIVAFRQEFLGEEEMAKLEMA